MMMFSTFGLVPDTDDSDYPTEERLQMGFTMVLTIITFKNLVNKNKPRVPYATLQVRKISIHHQNPNGPEPKLQYKFFIAPISPF